jgi:hypothetical protein
MVDGIVAAVSSVTDAASKTDSTNNIDDSINKSWFSDALDMYDLAYGPNGSEWFSEWYNGLFGKLGGHEYVCWKLPEIFTPRFYSKSLSDGVELDKDGKAYLDMSKYGEPRGGKTFISGDDTTIEWGKIFYCLTAKLFLFPWFHIFFFLARYTIIFFNILFVPLQFIFYAIINTVTFGLANLNFNYKNKAGIDKTIHSVHLGHAFKALVGITLPYYKFDAKFGQRYGTGGLGFLILAIMAISAVIIFVGGSSVTVVVIGFAMYCLKLIRALGDFSTDGKEAPATSKKE